MDVLYEMRSACRRVQEWYDGRIDQRRERELEQISRELTDLVDDDIRYQWGGPNSPGMIRLMEEKPNHDEIMSAAKAAYDNYRTRER